ncbi:hypothetical protein AB447_209120 [Bacillus glycinifermentans]|uniref:Uncharacterized protein n=1 Tax=Bacillus glycinifermentans TaxID=1664069 RepID=A0A0T6BI64_9BACI|nr:hypothetical protein AB447_209120 [Bacillus glycinifermentans]
MKCPATLKCFLKNNLKIDYRRREKPCLHHCHISFIGDNVKDLKLIKENVDKEEVTEYLQEEGN